MRQTTALLILLAAAVLEAGGDALIRSGLRAPVSGTRALYLDCRRARSLHVRLRRQRAALGLRPAARYLRGVLFRGGAGHLVGGVRPAAGPVRHPRRIPHGSRRPRDVGRLTLTRRGPARACRSGRAGPIGELRPALPHVKDVDRLVSLGRDEDEVNLAPEVRKRAADSIQQSRSVCRHELEDGVPVRVVVVEVQPRRRGRPCER